MSKTIKHIAVSGGAFLNPLHVGSSVQYRLTLDSVPPYTSENGKLREGSIDLSGQVTLTDCDRMIKWSIGDYTEADCGEGKLNAAIAVLQEVRHALRAAKIKKHKLEKEYNIKDEDA